MLWRTPPISFPPPMRRRLLILTTSVLLVGAAALWWGRAPSFLFEKRAVETDRPSQGDPLSSVTLGGIPDAPDRETIVSLFESRVGSEVSSPFDPARRAVVTMRHRHPDGTLSLGLRLPGGEADAGGEVLTAHLDKSPLGGVEGHLLSQNSPVARILETDPAIGSISLRDVPVSDLLCSTFDRGALRMGLSPEPSEALAGAGQGPAGSVPLLSSRPESARVIYLNFDGQTVSGTAWNSQFNEGEDIVAAPFANASLIGGIWEAIAEDYAVFDVDVTTDRDRFENSAPSRRVMAILTPTKAWYGANIGGAAYLNSFGSSANPYVWIFNESLKGAIESGAHEIGHTLGLHHDGNSSTNYYSGHEHPSGVRWAPIMGTGYSGTITQFSKGEYPDADQHEDDLDEIADTLPLIPDTHGGSAGSATLVPGNGGVLDLKGIIGPNQDVDVFRLVTGATGPVSVNATHLSLHPNLDLALEFLDAGFESLATAAPEGPFDASVHFPSLPAGTYYLRVFGSGLGTLANGYGRYGSVGAYTLGGSFTPVAPPGIPTNLTASDGTATSHVALSWAAVPFVEGYHIYRGTYPDEIDAEWLASSTSDQFDDSTAVPGVEYFYFVTAHNSSGESQRSVGDSGWRQWLAPAAPSGLSASTNWPHSIWVSWNAGARAQTYRIFRNNVNSLGGAVQMGTTSELSWHDTSTSVGAPYYYFVRSENTGGNSSFAGTPAPGVKAEMPPGTPSDLSASDGDSPNHVSVTWDPAVGAVGYHLYRNTAESTSGATPIATLGSASHSHVDATATPGKDYWYFVRANQGGGTLSTPSNLDRGHRLLLAPEMPDSVTATPSTQPDGALLSWDPTPGATRYRIYRSAGATPEAAIFLGETVDPEWLDETVAPGRSYYYFVRAANDAGISSYSVPVPGHGQEVDPLDDGLENNDMLSMSTSLVSPEISAKAVSGDPDWYALSLDQVDVRLDVAVPHAATPAPLGVTLFDDAGAPLATAHYKNGAAVLSRESEPGAAYFIRVENEADGVIPYTLIWRTPSEGQHGIEPDMRIGPRLPATVGSNLRNAGGAGQTLSMRVRGSRARRIFAVLLNRSAVPGAFTTRQIRPPRSVRLDAFRQVSGRWQRVSGALRRRGVTTALEPFERVRFRLSAKIRKSTSRRPRASILPFTSHVRGDRATVDTVRWRIVPVRRR